MSSTPRLWIAFGTALALCGSPSIALCADPAPVTRGRYLMGTQCEARAFGDPRHVGPALDRALDRIAALEQVLTTWRPDGELAIVNAACATAGQTVRISNDLLHALRGARRWAARTGGAFDPTIGALASAWGLRVGGLVPDTEGIDRALALTSWHFLHIDSRSRTVRCDVPGVELDLGGYGKGLALDEAARELRRHGVSRALLNFGGQVLALGAPPAQPGWVVELAHPADRMRPVAALILREGSLSTSSNGERGHVLDPRTGRPVTWTGTVSVLAPTGAAADALSTALLVAGAERGAALLPRNTEFIALESADSRVRVAAGTSQLIARLTWRDGERSER